MEWIKRSDQDPDIDVILALEDNEYLSPNILWKYLYRDGSIGWEDNESRPIDFKYWMPIPKNPEE